MNKLTGLIAAPYTPFDKDGQLNVKAIDAYADFLKSTGVSGVFVNGTTGEGVSLTLEERMATAEQWCRHQDQQFKVLVHVGHNSLEISKKLAEHAGKAGADAIGLVSPVFYKPESIETLVALSAELAGTVPELPFYYYHIPGQTGVAFPMIDYLATAEKQIPNLAGIKYTHEDLMDMKLCLEYANGKYDVLHGRDEILLCGLVLGVKGAIGSTYNYMAPLFRKIMDAFDARDLELANRLQLEAIRIIQVLIRYGGAVKAGKSIMRLAGLDFGQPRLPVVGLSNEGEKELHNSLTALNFKQYSRIII